MKEKKSKGLKNRGSKRKKLINNRNKGKRDKESKNKMKKRGKKLRRKSNKSSSVKHKKKPAFRRKENKNKSVIKNKNKDKHKYSVRKRKKRPKKPKTKAKLNPKNQVELTTVILTTFSMTILMRCSGLAKFHQVDLKNPPKKTTEMTSSLQTKNSSNKYQQRS